MALIIVSNRLPITLTENGFFPSIGGLATGLQALLFKLSAENKAFHYEWVGWPGKDFKKEERFKIAVNLKAGHCYPVFISENIVKRFYSGFCNKTLWPLFHFFSTYSSYEKEEWLIYKQVNEYYAVELSSIIQPEDQVWVHDYHLFLVPQLLRKKFPDLAIGFFSHIPFPAFEIFQCLPHECRAEILKGILGADLVGFHTYDYSQNFTQSIIRTLGYDQNMGFILTHDRLVKIDAYPMSIDFAAIQDQLQQVSIKNKRTALLQEVKGTKVILSIDRLDYTKGIANRLLAYHAFLKQYPEWKKRVVFVMIAAPSREGVDRYRSMKRELDELVGHINGELGSIDWTPILYQYKTFSLNELIALYSASDIAMITPLRDGMNLIAKEYLAAQSNDRGMLILSETAGAAKELSEAILVNPYSQEEMAEAIYLALTMDEMERRYRIYTMQNRLKRYDVIQWGKKFLTDLTLIKEKQANFLARFMNGSDLEKMLKEWIQADKKLLLLDYDGTLVPFNVHPHLARPSASLLTLLKKLTQIQDCHVAILSGREKQTLETWLGQLSLTLVAEHGAWIKRTRDADWTRLALGPNEWKKDILPFLESFVDRLPGTFIEEKEFAVAWHYRNADPGKGPDLAKELAEHLVHLTANINVQVMLGKKVIEVKSAEIGKDTAALQLMAGKTYDFILAVGDDITDEAMFKVIPVMAHSIKVGSEASSAQFNLKNQNEVLSLLSQFVKISETV